MAVVLVVLVLQERERFLQVPEVCKSAMVCARLAISIVIVVLTIQGRRLEYRVHRAPFTCTPTSQVCLLALNALLVLEHSQLLPTTRTSAPLQIWRHSTR